MGNRPSKRLARGARLAVAAAVAFATTAVLAGSVAAAPPSNQSAPRILGEHREGAVVAASTGVFAGTEPFTFRYQWQRCNSAVTSCSDLPGQTHETYTVISADIGRTLRVRVTAQNSEGSDSASSSATGVIAANPSNAPDNVDPPTISGNATIGNELTVSPGNWQRASSFSYEWLRCDRTGNGCASVQGPNSDRTYTLTSSSAGRTVRSVVRASNSSGTTTGTTAKSALVSGGPAVTSQPSVSGTPQQGRVLTANPGSYSGTQPITFSYQWQRCDGNGNNCFNIAGATSQTYTLTSADVGRRIRVQVTAKNSTGQTVTISQPVGPVAASGSQPPPSTSIPTSQVSLPDQLLIDRVDFVPNRIRAPGQTIIGRFHIVSVKTGKPVSGALVLGLGVPFDRLTNPGEVVSGGDGWAQASFTVKRTFPLRRGNLVVVFVRARKAGDNVLAGVSARRLVSLRVG